MRLLGLCSSQLFPPLQIQALGTACLIIYSDEVLYLGRMYSLVLLSLEAGISFNKLKYLRIIILLSVLLSEPLHHIGMNALDLVGEPHVQKHIATEKFNRYISVELAKL